jgi:hypothetical protein
MVNLLQQDNLTKGRYTLPTVDSGGNAILQKAFRGKSKWRVACVWKTSRHESYSLGRGFATVQVVSLTCYSTGVSKRREVGRPTEGRKVLPEKRKSTCNRRFRREHREEATEA